MDEKDERVKAVYEAPRVLECSKLRFETLISGPPIQCTPGFVFRDGMIYWSDCVENE